MNSFVFVAIIGVMFSCNWLLRTIKNQEKEILRLVAENKKLEISLILEKYSKI